MCPSDGHKKLVALSIHGECVVLKKVSNSVFINI